MANIEVLNNVTHQNLKVMPHPSASRGDNVGSILTFPTEYGSMLLEYPIFFRKDTETGEFCSIALLGLQENENLFLSGEQWHGHYLPLALARGPFVISFQDQRELGKSEHEPVISIDRESPKVSLQEGEKLFESNGEASQLTQQINRYLHAIHQGIEYSRLMFASFIKFDLIEPVDLDIKLDDGTPIKITGNYTIHEEKLHRLNGDALAELNKAGYLQAAYAVIASLNNMKKLIQLKNQKILSNPGS